MGTVMKHPGVYIVEQPAFPNSVVEVATAVPAFIGYTQIASYKGQDLTRKPWRISSMAEFEACFGKSPLTVSPASSAPSSAAPQTAPAAKPAAPAETPKPEASVENKSTEIVNKIVDPTAQTGQVDSSGQPEAPADKKEPATEGKGNDADASLSAEPILANATQDKGKSTDDPAAEKANQSVSGDPAKAAPVNTDQASAGAVKQPDAVPAQQAPFQLKFNVKDTKSATPALTKAFSLNGTDYAVSLVQGLNQYLLHSSMRFFFQNGGGPCYIVSVGTFNDSIDKDKLSDGIGLLLKEQEPTMVVVPDAVRLGTVDDFNSVQSAALQHCGKTRSRVAILDVYNGFNELQDGPVQTFRDKIGNQNLDFAAAYYPWLDTTMVGDSDVSYDNIDNSDLKELLISENLLPGILDDASYTPALRNKTLMVKSEAYQNVMKEVKKQLNRLPPSPAIAGVYSSVDGASGVWKAPANVSLNGVIAPTVSISDDEQDDLNVDLAGKSVNAIRSFIGQGVLVWGARTLDGNSLDWRYIGVRRTMIMLEQSIMFATKAYVFENNVSTTWVTIKSMIRNFLTGIWKRGGLAGATPDDAFQVFCGLGETMTGNDILEGILKVTVLVAVTRPAEFIEITFQQQMQKS